MENKINCLNIAYLFKASVGSINGAWNEGNVSTVKKVTLPSGQRIPYVSGQSLKYQIRRSWKEMGLTLSEVKQSEKGKGVNPTLGEPANYIDDDLLGFMIASKGENRRRTAAIRVSPAIGCFELKGDRDLGTKSKELSGESMAEGGNIFETEIYYNFFRVNILIELDRIGVFTKQETGKKEESSVNESVRKERLTAFLKALQYIWGGGKQSRLLTDMGPKFIAFTLQYVKSPIFLESLNVNEQEELDTNTISEVLTDNKTIIDKSFIGVRSGIFKNAKFPESYTSIDEAFSSVANTIMSMKL